MSRARQAYVYLGRIISPPAILGLRLYSVLTRRPRVRVLVTNERYEVLLLRSIVGHGAWSLPGGGVGRKESHTAAAARELYEETGITIDETDLKFVRVLKKPELDIPFAAPLFKVSVKSSSLPSDLFNPREIIEVKWFAVGGLPEPLSRIARFAIKK